jgi:pimeloyl-ACP methyl ester carboxylesterase
MWRDWYAPLATAGRRVIAVDLPGHGLSDKPGDPRVYRMEAMVAAVRDLLDAEGLTSVDVVAQSMAGTIAIELATERGSRISRTVLVNPACFGRVWMQGLARFVSPAVPDVVLPRLVARWMVARAHRIVYDNPSRINRRDEDEYWAPSQFPSYALAMRRLLNEFQWARPPAGEMAERLRAVERKMLVVLGSNDLLVRDALSYMSALRAAGSKLEFFVIPNGGHAVNEEKPDEVLRIVLEFFRRV